MNDYIVISNLKDAGFTPGAHSNALGKNWPKEYDCRFIEPGLINYDDMGAGTALVRKEALDNMAQSFKGCPVLFKLHDDVSPETFKEQACGLVNEVYYNANNGWYHAKFFIWDDATKAGILSGKYSVSCAYIPTDTNTDGGIYNNINYDMEVKNGEYTHLAIVENPRYNGAKIFINSKTGGNVMKEKVSKALSELKNAINEMFGKDPQKAAAGKEADVVQRLDSLISLLNDIKNEDAGETDEEKKKRLELEGKEKKNAEDEKKKEDDEKKKAEDEKKNADADAADKLKKEKENEDAEEKKKDEEKKNALLADKEKADADQKHFDEMKNKAASRPGQVTSPMVTKEERRAAGKKKYGSETI